jgi:polar amino acid transport system substrate-binding protein
MRLPSPRFCGLAFWGIGALLLAAVAAWLSLSGGDGLARVRKAGVLRVGYAVEAPYALVAPDGRITGESPETARLVAARLGISRIDWVQTRFDALIVELLEGRFDMIAAGMFVTPDRARRVGFSDPTLRVGASLLVPAGNPSGFGSYADLIARPHARVAVVAGTIEEGTLLARGLPRPRLLAVPDAAAGVAAVRSGAVEALALSRPTTLWLEHLDPGRVTSVKVPGRAAVADPVPLFHIAFAFAPDDRELLRAWNRAQAEVLGGPEHMRVLADFGLGADDLPSGVEGTR